MGAGDPALRGRLGRYFAPHEGSATTAYAVYNIASLADYEAYRARLKDDAQGRENFAFAKRKQFIRREDRVFLRWCRRRMRRSADSLRRCQKGRQQGRA